MKTWGVNSVLKCHYKADMLVFADETGFDWRNIIRRKGYSLRGKPAISKQLIVRGVHVSVIAAISSKGLLDLKYTEVVALTAMLFVVTKQLLLHLYPFNGSNPRSVIILDNCNIHHTNNSILALQECGTLIHYLPAYSPDYNPIENVYSKVKTVIKQIESCDINRH